MVYVAEGFAFLIVLYILYRFARPPLARLIAQREETIRQQVEAAEHAASRKADAQQKYDEAVESAEHEASRIRDDARADADRITEEMRERAVEEAERIRRRGDEALDNSRLQTVRELKGEAGGHATALADRLVRQELQSESAQTASVDSFLDEVARMAPGGGSGSDRVTTHA